MKVTKSDDSKGDVCNCKRQVIPSNVGEIIDKIIQGTACKGKTTIKIEIEIHNDWKCTLMY